MPQISATINSKISMTLTPLKKALLETEYKFILEALEKTNFKKTAAGELLGIDRTTINNKIKLYQKMRSEEENQTKKSIPGNY
jgi:DNA-binding NtrC family response regulator